MQAEKTIGTHSGAFHMDEVLGATMLTKYTKEWKDAKITRTRDDKILAGLDLIIDVGGKYDPATLRFDHHQKEFTLPFAEGYPTKMSSAGLVYKHYGREVIRNVIQSLLEKYNIQMNISEQDYEDIYQRIYDNFILYVDGVDNGVEAVARDVKQIYRPCGHLAQRVARLVPANYEKASYDERFFEAMNVCEEELREQLRETVFGWLRSKKIVEDAFNKRFDVHSSGAIVRFEESCAWKSGIFAIEKKNNVEGQVKYILFPDEAGGEGWRVQTVPIDQGSFISRKTLKTEWCGVMKDQLKEKTGLPDVVFVHANGFIGGCRSYEGALKMAILSLEDPGGYPPEGTVNSKKNEGKMQPESSS